MKQIRPDTAKGFHNFVSGHWVEGSAAQANINPSDTNDVIGAFSIGSEGLADDAIAAARAAFPTWSRTTAQFRGDILFRAAGELSARSSELGQLLSREEGKTLIEGIGEVARAAQIMRYYAGEALRLRGERLPSIRAGVELEVTREPVGVIGIITPWNFPIAIPVWKVAAALAFGNCVIFKPSDMTPAMGWALIDILARAGLPEGVIGLIMGPGSVIGAAIVDRVDAVSFTGSGPVGRSIAVRAAGRMIPVQLEMGGKNPLVVLDDADLDIALEVAADGAFFQTGQRCTASSRLIVTEGVHDRFVDRLKNRMASFVVDHALKDGTQIGPVVNEGQLLGNLDYLKIGKSEGAICTGGERIDRVTPGFYMKPALLTETTNDMRINREEIFGPVASVIRVRDYDEALATANDTTFGLSAGICTTSLKYARDFHRNAVAGLTMVNTATAGADYHVPFGGRKASSFGPREQGSYAAEFYTVVKTSYTAA